MEKQEFKRQLAALLKRNARMANQEMADRLGVSEPVIAATIQEMENDGDIMGYTAIMSAANAQDEAWTALYAEWEKEAATAAIRHEDAYAAIGYLN